MRYSLEPLYRRYVQGQGFMSFARNIGNKYGKSMISSKNVRKIFDKSLDVGKSMKKKYGKKILDNSLSAGKDFAKIAGKKVLIKSAEATGDLIGNKIADRITKSARNKENVVSRAKDDGIVRAGEGSKKPLNSLLPFHPLTNIEISEYYSNESKFNGVYSRDNLQKTTKKGAYVINLDEYENTGTHWIALFVKTNEVVYFGSFGIEHIPKEINKFIGSNNNKKIKANIFRIQAYDSIM